MLLLISAAAFTSTLLGGLFALRLQDRLHLILGFSAGAVIGVAFFELIPEALEIGSRFNDIRTIVTMMAIGFVSYLILDRFILLHSHSDSEHAHHRRGIFGAGTLSLHSLLDGVAIGLAFQVSTELGAVVTLAVLAHDFSDGINTVSMITKNGGERMQAMKWLLVDAVAPAIGIAATLLIAVQESHLGLILALFAGFFLYIGASDLLPESHHTHPVYWTTITSVVGILVMYIIVSTAGA